MTIEAEEYAEDDLCIYQIVNSVGPTSVPADIAVGIARYTDHQSKILTWFSADELDREPSVEVGCVSASRGFFNPNAYRRAREELRDADVLQTHHTHAGLYAKLLAKDLGIPVIRTEQTTHDRYTTIGKLSNGLSNPFADAVTNVSQTVADSFSWWESAILSDEARRVIPNGVDLELLDQAIEDDWSIYRQTDIDAASFVVGHAGRFIDDKDQDVLIRAISHLEDGSAEKIELVLAGDGERRAELIQLAEELGIRGHVHFVGLLDRREVYQMMRDVDVYAMPSKREGFCVAVAEAMATETPCLLSDIEVFRELYSEAAHFHSVGDPTSLSAGLRTLLEDESQRASLGADGRALVESQYALETVIGEYQQLFQEIV